MAGRQGQPEDDLAWHVSKLFILVMNHLTRAMQEFGEALALSQFSAVSPPGRWPWWGHLCESNPLIPS